MCSTPRPKTKVKGKSGISGGLLSNMSPEARSRFAERANAAQERRQKITQEAQQKKRLDASVESKRKAVTPSAKKAQKGLSYWLLNASLKDVFIALFSATPKRA